MYRMILLMADPFDYYRFGLTEDSSFRATANSAYSLLITIGVLGILLTLILAGMKLMSPDVNKRREALEDIKWKAVIAIILFSIPSIIGVVLSFVASFM